jgi:hypothetical protein
MEGETLAVTSPKSKRAESAKLKVITFNKLWSKWTGSRFLMPACS